MTTVSITLFAVVATLLLASLTPLNELLLTAVFFLFGTSLLVLSFRASERIAVFPATLFIGTGFLQIFFSHANFHWYGDLIISYLLLSSVATVVYYLFDNTAGKYLGLGFALLICGATAWMFKRFVWPWKLLPQLTWGIPLLIVISGLLLFFYQKRNLQEWERFRNLENEKSSTHHS